MLGTAGRRGTGSRRHCRVVCEAREKDKTSSRRIILVANSERPRKKEWVLRRGCRAGAGVLEGTRWTRSASVNKKCWTAAAFFFLSATTPQLHPLLESSLTLSPSPRSFRISFSFLNNSIDTSCLVGWHSRYILLSLTPRVSCCQRAAINLKHQIPCPPFPLDRSLEDGMMACS